jgi:putative transposase
MIEPEHPRLSVARQCELISISRSGFYYRPTGETPLNLALMRLIDQQFLETPWYGSRQMARHLRREGYAVGRKRVRRLMARMGLEPIYQRPRTTVSHPGHQIYPYLLRDLVICRPNQAWCADITYIPMRRGFQYLIAIMDWATRKVLSWRLSNTMDSEFCIEALEEALVKFGRPEIFNTDSKNDGVGRLRRSVAQSDEWPEHCRHSRVSSVALTRTPIDRASRLSLDLSGG